jgi:hypothetical protein
MIGSLCSILDGRDSLDTPSDALWVFFTSPTVTFNWEPCAEVVGMGGYDL